MTPTIMLQEEDTFERDLGENKKKGNNHSKMKGGKRRDNFVFGDLDSDAADDDDDREGTAPLDEEVEDDDDDDEEGTPTPTQLPDDEEQEEEAEESEPNLADLMKQEVEDAESLSNNDAVAESGGGEQNDSDSIQEPGLKDLLYQEMGGLSNATTTTTTTTNNTNTPSAVSTATSNYTEGTSEFEGESGDMETPIEVLNRTNGTDIIDEEAEETEGVDSEDNTLDVATSNYTEGTSEFEGESGDMEMPIEVLNSTDDTEINDEEAEEETEGVDSEDNTNEDVDTQATIPPEANEEGGTNPPQEQEATNTPQEEEEATTPTEEVQEATTPPDENTGEDIGTTDTAKLPAGSNGMGNNAAIIGTPTGSSDWDVPAPAFTLPPGTLEDCDRMCQMKEHPYVIYMFLAFVPLLMLWCCRRYCCADKNKDSRGRYSTIAAQYGDMSYDNTFSDDYSAEGGSFDGDDLEESSWGKSNGKRVLEMTNISDDSEQHNGGLSLEEMNG